MDFARRIASVFLCALLCSGVAAADDLDPYKPVFTGSQQRVADIKKRFPDALVKNASDYEPLVLAWGTHVHMGFWSGSGNHGILARLVDAINAGDAFLMNDPTQKIPGCKSKGNCAVFADGASSMNQFPEFSVMLKEHWYERGTAQGEGQPFSRTVMIYRRSYNNIRPLYFADADSVWGAYSQGYANMARIFKQKTGNPVTIWVFVNGGTQQRIFDKFERPVLRQLENEHVVEIYCAKSNNIVFPLDQDLSSFEKGLSSVACIPTKVPPNDPKLINIFNRN